MAEAAQKSWKPPRLWAVQDHTGETWFWVTQSFDSQRWSELLESLSTGIILWSYNTEHKDSKRQPNSSSTHYSKSSKCSLLLDTCHPLVPSFVGLYDEQKNITENTTALKEFCDSTSNEMTGSQGTKTQKMTPRASFSWETYWSWITQKRAGKGQEEYDNFCSHMLKLNQVTQEETVPGVLTFSFSRYRNRYAYRKELFNSCSALTYIAGNY